MDFTIFLQHTVYGIVTGSILLLATIGFSMIYTIKGFGKTLTGSSYLITNEEIDGEETGLALELQVKSKYNVLPDGSSLNIDYVDTNARVVKIFRPKVARQCEKITATDEEEIDMAADRLIEFLQQRSLI